MDFWRVEAFEPDRLMRLFAQMKLPGRAYPQSEVEADGAASIIGQTAIFDPIGLLGLLYWYAPYPARARVRRDAPGIVRELKKEQELREV